MNWSPSLPAARARVTRFMTARASVARKGVSSWATVATNVPCAVELMERGGGNDPDPLGGSPDDVLMWQISFPFGTDAREGDRLTIAGGDGAASFPVMTVNAPIVTGLLVMHQVIATAEVSAVERYTITVERWDEGLAAYATVGTYSAQAVIEANTPDASGQDGAIQTAKTGTVMVPADASILVGDFLFGLPYGRSVLVSEVYAPVAGRKDVRFVVQLGGE